MVAKICLQDTPKDPRQAHPANHELIVALQEPRLPNRVRSVRTQDRHRCKFLVLLLHQAVRGIIPQVSILQFQTLAILLPIWTPNRFRNRISVRARIGLPYSILPSGGNLMSSSFITCLTTASSAVCASAQMVGLLRPVVTVLLRFLMSTLVNKSLTYKTQHCLKMAISTFEASASALMDDTSQRVPKTRSFG